MDAGAEGLDDLALFHDLGQVDAMRRAAVGDADDDLLRDVDQTARQVAGVGGTERGIGQPFRAPREEMKYSRAERPSRKFALIGISIVRPFVSAIKPRIPAS